jgi:agmatinase
MVCTDLYLSSAPLVTNIAPGKKPIMKVLGVPFDFTSTYRSGSRFGPDAIREAFLNIEIYSHRLNVDLENAEYMVKSIGKVISEISSDEVTLGILGGEHTITHGAYTRMPKDTILVIFDAHLDLRDEYANLKLNHATFLRRLIEQRGASSILHIGARAATYEEWRYADKMGLKIITTQSILSMQRPEDRLRHFLENAINLYVSIDLDVLDPAFAPAVGNPEPAGLSTHQILEFLYTLKNKRIRAFDIVELTPPYDNGTTATLAARLLAELACIGCVKKNKTE